MEMSVSTTGRKYFAIQPANKIPAAGAGHSTNSRMRSPLWAYTLETVEMSPRAGSPGRSTPPFEATQTTFMPTRNVMPSPERFGMEWIFVSVCVVLMALMASFAVVRVLWPPKKDEE